MTPHLTSVLAAAFAGTLAAGSLGCDTVDCGTGTVERSGACVPADDNPDDAQCGAGTKLGPSGTCVPERDVFCDPDTTNEQIDPETGAITCVGDSGGCSTPLPCPAPSAGKITICGRVLDTQTDQPIADTGGAIAQCDPANPSATGPCSLKLTFVDALQFGDDPQGAPAHIPAEFVLDTCGRFRASDLELSLFGFTGIAIDDATGAADRYKLTGVALDDNDARPARGFAGYATRNETDTAWTGSSNISGASFATRGVLAAIFRHGTTPVAGVKLRRQAQLVPNDDYYFTDTVASSRTTVAPANGQDMTGADGAVLAVNPADQAVHDHDGVGAEPSGCHWPSSLAASIAGVVFVQLKIAETAGGTECP